MLLHSFSKRVRQNSILFFIFFYGLVGLLCFMTCDGMKYIEINSEQDVVVVGIIDGI
jgi:hypothetical protein